MEGKILPQYLELEEVILGYLLSYSNSANIIFTNLQDIDFYRHEHQVIFNAAKEIYVKGGKVDLFTVLDKIKGSGINAALLMDYSNKVVSTAHIEEHIAVLKDYSARRQFIQKSHEAIRQAYEGESRQGVNQ